MTTTLTIDPMTRLEGHGKIHIVLDDKGEVERALFQVPELRGFESFVVGRPAVDMPQIVSRICGVCPTAQHLAATKALDDLFGVTPPPAARAIRELVYHAFMLEDHALHFYFLGGPDILLGAPESATQRNVLGLLRLVGRDDAKKIISMRSRLRELITSVAGKVVHPVFGLPGGVSRRIEPSRRDQIQAVARDSMTFALDAFSLFDTKVLGDERSMERFVYDSDVLETFSMGTVDKSNQVSFYGGVLRVTSPDGSEHARFDPHDYAGHIAEHVEPWTCVTFPYLRDPGWKGFTDGIESGVYRVAPLARLNASTGYSTPRAHQEYERLIETFNGRTPVRQTLAYHWARLIEMIYAAERLEELATSEELYAPEVRNMDLGTPTSGVGCVEAPRGTLIHHYATDSQGVITACNLIVATHSNSAAICLSIERAARRLIHKGVVDDGILNEVEMAFRAYDPCLTCASHSLPGTMPLHVDIVDHRGRVTESLRKL